MEGELDRPGQNHRIIKNTTDITTNAAAITVLENNIIAPDFDSGWTALAAGAGATETHNLGGDADDYFIDFYFNDDADSKPHNVYIGAYQTAGGQTYGMYFYDLNNTEIKVWRNANDTICDKYRIRIWVTQ